MRARTGVLAAAAVVGVVAWAVRDIPVAMGAREFGERANRMRRSSQYRDGRFHNRVPARALPPGSGWTMLRELLVGEHHRHPSGPIPLGDPGAGGPASDDGLQVTWYGHSSALVEIEGRTVLFDPVWSDRCSPSRLLGPRRMHPPPVAIEELPRLDAIVISHDHYDHLDQPTVEVLVRSQTAPFVVPLGVGAHLDRWGVPADRIIELDWDESTMIGDVRLTATEARHFSGRGFSRDGTLWASWVVTGRERRAFYTGDSGYFDDYAAIGAAYGPFDVTLMQIGAYGEGWPDIHMTPEDAVRAHRGVRGDLLIPLHWATFNLALHDWAEPADRLWREAKAEDVRLAVPRPGERIDVDDPPLVDGWWQAIA
jgi:L-ascorbate metabolism protein UlaG (beta-lactamase superfamily)